MSARTAAAANSTRHAVYDISTPPEEESTADTEPSQGAGSSRDHETIMQCIICFEEDVDTKMMPCEHAHFCNTCAGLVLYGAVHDRPVCPVCRAPVTDIASATMTEVRQQSGERPRTAREANYYAALVHAQQQAGTMTFVGNQTAGEMMPVLASSLQALTHYDRRPRGKGRGRGPGREGPYFPWWPGEWESIEVYQSQKLEDDEVGLMPDTGAHDNLCGELWARRQAEVCVKASKEISQHVTDHPQVVKGVGKGKQTASYEVKLGLGLLDTEGEAFEDTFTAPCLEGSSVPGLLGIRSLKKCDALIRCKTGEIWFLGKGGAEIKPSPGSRCFQMKEAPSGHWMIPISHFRADAKLQEWHLVSERAAARGDQQSN